MALLVPLVLASLQMLALAPTLLLLHGLPSSSRMFEPLFDRLSDRYHLVAPDYPGFGHSDWPDPRTDASCWERPQPGTLRPGPLER